MNCRFSMRVFLTVIFGILVVSASMVFATESSCLLKIVATNDLAKTGSVFVDGKLQGELDLGELVIFDLDIGAHKITVDGKLIEKQELDVAFENAYESKQIDVKAILGRRAVRIISEPSNALIRVNEDWLGQKTPWQIVLQVGKSYEIELLKDNHGSTVETLEILEKGEVILLDIVIPEAETPNEPNLVYPSNGATDLILGEVILKWESTDSASEFEVEFNEEVIRTHDLSLAVQLNEKGREYKWKVTAISEFDKRSISEEFSFTTISNVPPNKPQNLFPENGTDNYPDALILQWQCEDPDGDRLRYDVFLGTGDDLALEQPEILSSKLLISELEPGAQYFWKVIARDAFGGVAEGPLWAFSTSNSTLTEDSAVSSLSEVENTVDDSAKIDELKDEVVSLEWAIEEVKTLIRENTSLIANKVDRVDTRDTIDYTAQIEGLRGKVVNLEWQIEELQRLLESSVADLREIVLGINETLNSEKETYVEEMGKGIRIRIESGFKGDSVLHDSDILFILNELYAMRAIHISLNGKRVTPYTYVRCVGATIIINDEPTQISPIVIEVLGDYDYLVSGLGLLKEFFAGRDIDMTFLPLEFITIPASSE